MSIKRVKQGGITTAAGFKASGMSAGIKVNRRKYDCSLVVSEVPAVSAGVFTINKAKAWPLLYDESVIGKSTHRAILANSGNANCFNGPSGKKTVQKSLEALSSELGVKTHEILLSSTGIIGKPFPIECLVSAIPTLVKQLSRSGGTDAAKGILTTDTKPKEIAVQFHVGGKLCSLGGFAKGAGMVCPTMALSGARHATMLCFLSSDVSISKALLERALAEVTEQTFNNIVIDNDMSTNDMVVAFANGLAGNEKITQQDKDYKIFKKALSKVCAHLSRELVKDGEGVTHVCEIKIKNAKTDEEARRVGKLIATSMLFKTMLAGEDPNWGRVVASIGASQVEFSKYLDISFDGIYILKNGKGLIKNREKVRKILKKKTFTLQVDLKKGKCENTFLTSDLTKFYVWINSSYSS